jgi:hypothetical protein
MKKTYEKPSLSRAGRLSASTAQDRNFSGPGVENPLPS